MKCVIFIEKREKQNKNRKNKLKIWEKFKKRPKKIWLFSEKRKTESGTTEKSRRINPFGADIWISLQFKKLQFRFEWCESFGLLYCDLEKKLFNYITLYLPVQNKITRTFDLRKFAHPLETDWILPSLLVEIICFYAAQAPASA